MLKKNKFIFKSGVAFILKIGGMLLGYLLTIYLARELGSFGVGTYSLFMSITTLLGILSLAGFGMATQRFVGEFQAKKQLYLLDQYYKFAVVIVILAAAMFSLFLFIGKEVLHQYVFHEPSSIVILTIAAVTIPLFTLNDFKIEFLRALGFIAFSEVFRNIFKPLGVIVLLYVFVEFNSEVSVYIPLLAFSITVLVSYLILSSFLDKQIKKYKEPKAKVDLAKPEVIDVAFPLLVASMGALILSHIDTLMIASLMTVKDVGFYSVGVKVAYVTAVVLLAINTVIATQISKAYAAGEKTKLDDVVRLSSRLIFFGTLPIAFIILFFNEPILLLFGEEFLDGKWVLVVLTIGQMLNALTGSVGILLSMTGHQRFVRNVVWIVLMINIGFNFWLIPIWGIEGAAFATAGSLVLQNLVMAIYAYKTVGVNTLFRF